MTKESRDITEIGLQTLEHEEIIKEDVLMNLIFRKRDPYKRRASDIGYINLA